MAVPLPTPLVTRLTTRSDRLIEAKITSGGGARKQPWFSIQAVSRLFFSTMLLHHPRDDKGFSAIAREWHGRAMLIK